MKQSEEYRSRHSMEVPGKSTEVPGKSTEVPGKSTEVPDNCQELPTQEPYCFWPLRFSFLRFPYFLAVPVAIADDV